MFSVIVRFFTVFDRTLHDPKWVGTSLLAAVISLAASLLVRAEAACTSLR